MNASLTLINIIVLVIFIVILHVTARKHISFAKRVFTALRIGIVFGVLLCLIYGTHSNVITSTGDWLNIVGQGYVALLQVIVMPLIFVSIVAAFTKIQIGEKLAKIGSLIFIFSIGTVTIAAIVGVVYALVLGLDASTTNLGNAEQARGSEIAKQARDLTAHTLPQQILELLPENPFLDFTGQRAASTVVVMVFASFIGFAYLRIACKQPDHGELLKHAIDAIYSLVVAIVAFVLCLTPYGVLTVMANTLSTSDLGAIWTLGKFLIASYAALITMYIIHLIILSLLGISPIRYVKKTLEILVFASTSRSSVGALSLDVQTQTKRLGVPEGIANFAATFGLSIGQNGRAGIYPAMLAIMVTPVASVEIDLQFIVTLIAVVIISSFGVADVGGGATFTSVLVSPTLSLPVALAGMLISAEPLIGMSRTVSNANDSMLAGTDTAKLTKHWGKGTFDSNDNAALTSH